jgi:hypothetical protein
MYLVMFVRKGEKRKERREGYKGRWEAGEGRRKERAGNEEDGGRKEGRGGTSTLRWLALCWMYLGQLLVMFVRNRQGGERRGRKEKGGEKGGRREEKRRGGEEGGRYLEVAGPLLDVPRTITPEDRRKKRGRGRRERGGKREEGGKKGGRYLEVAGPLLDVLRTVTHNIRTTFPPGACVRGHVYFGNDTNSPYLGMPDDFLNVFYGIISSGRLLAFGVVLVVDVPEPSCKKN